MARGLSWSEACGIILHWGLTMSPGLAGRFFTTEPSGKPTSPWLALFDLLKFGFEMLTLHILS